ncbi:MAG: hypothetical protein JJT85_04665 [Chromatiales bacterium]|nr:hypothetical protein [Chromatiales bacterium]
MSRDKLGRPALNWSKETLLSIDESLLSDKEKQRLAAQLFPEGSLAPWKQSLLTQWSDRDRWDRYLSGDAQLSGLKPFNRSNKMLILTAKHRPRLRYSARVSDFCSWVYSLYAPRPRAEQLAAGSLGERSVQSYKRREALLAKAITRPANHASWELIHEDPLDGEAPAKRISTLRLDGQPLYGCPDLVFRQKKTGRIAIIERKISKAKIPSDGWPNLQAQLWAYSHIDEWAALPDIILIGEIWGISFPDHNAPVVPRLRCVIKYSRRDEWFEWENLQLFLAYGGERVEGYMAD